MPGTGFDYRPSPREWRGEKMPELPGGKQAEMAYEAWRKQMIYANYGPQNRKA